MNTNPPRGLKRRSPLSVSLAGFVDPGSYLLSRDLSSDYHRRADVSLPGSEWDRVGPSGYDHQASGSFSLAACLVVIAAWVLLFCCSAVFRLTGMLTSAWHGDVLNRVLKNLALSKLVTGGDAVMYMRSIGC